MKAYSFKVGDVIKCFTRSWVVHGVHLGGLGGQNLICLHTDSFQPVGSAYGKPVIEMFIPEEILVAAIEGKTIPIMWLRQVEVVDQAVS